MVENVHGNSKSDFFVKFSGILEIFQNRAEIPKGTPCAGGNGPILMEIDRFYTFPMDPARSCEGGIWPGRQNRCSDAETDPFGELGAWLERARTKGLHTAFVGHRSQ